MCVAVPARVLSMEGNRATVAIAGARLTALMDLVPEAEVGDYVLVHAGFALQVLDEAEAAASLRELTRLSALMEADDGRNDGGPAA